MRVPRQRRRRQLGPRVLYLDACVSVCVYVCMCACVCASVNLKKNFRLDDTRQVYTEDVRGGRRELVKYRARMRLFPVLSSCRRFFRQRRRRRARVGAREPIEWRGGRRATTTRARRTRRAPRPRLRGILDRRRRRADDRHNNSIIDSTPPPVTRARGLRGRRHAVRRRRLVGVRRGFPASRTRDPAAGGYDARWSVTKILHTSVFLPREQTDE